MIARLRRVHGIAAALSPFLVAAFAIALLGKKPDAVAASLPAEDRGATTEDLGSVSDIARARELPSALGTVFVLAAPDAQRLLVMQKGEPAPDTLAYWTGAEGAIAELPKDAQLLGPVGPKPRAYQRPSGRGQVVFFSLAHGTTLAHGAPEGN